MDRAISPNITELSLYLRQLSFLLRDISSSYLSPGELGKRTISLAYRDISITHSQTAISLHLCTFKNYLCKIKISPNNMQRFNIQLGLYTSILVVCTKIYGLKSTVPICYFSSTGIMNTLGRFSAGILANCSYIGALATCNFGVLCCALDCFLFRFCMTFQTLCAFSAALGYFLGKK